MNKSEKLQILKEEGWIYNPNTGLLIGTTKPTFDNKGYLRIKIVRNKIRICVRAHQLAYYLYYNEIVEQIDHINGVRDDNRIDNLRSVTNQKNSFNRKCKGYSFDKNYKKYRAYICVDNKTTTLGYFLNEEDARQAYIDAKKIYHII